MAQGADTIQEVMELQFRLGDKLLERLMGEDGLVLMHVAKQVRICISLDPETKKRIIVKPLPKPKKAAPAKPTNTKTRRKKSR